jgi:prepilin-type N-terminal cleavage/methylation domain-containing protein
MYYRVHSGCVLAGRLASVHFLKVLYYVNKDTVMRHTAQNNKGFTLLEVMVSVAILAISLAVLTGFQGNTLIASARQEKLTIATMLAREKMVESEIDIDNAMQKGEFPDERSEEAVFDEPFEDYRWKMTLKKVELPAPVQAQEGSMQDVIAQQLTQEIGKTVRELRLEVSWEEMGQPQTLEVVTHIIKM